MNTNRIGLEKAQAKKLAEQLNVLLANYSVFYQNTRGYHWNIKGEKFFELHLKFEELYDDLLLKIDEVAERILTLGQTPEHSYSQYANLSTIKESEKVSDQKADELSFAISQKIQTEMTYPGQVKVTLIREKRAVNYAK